MDLFFLFYFNFILQRAFAKNKKMIDITAFVEYYVFCWR